ncbi:hypothetical protein HY970_01960, partial [Candidatus Kaiserbacteria bacterium]|nr:hypothetical protein [Candidatus Kaiserbacteria bacterium]
MKMLRQSLAISLITLIIMPYPALADTSTPQTTTSATSTPAQESPTTKPEAAPSVAPPDGEGGVPPPSGPESASSENDPTYGPERSAVASTLRVEPDKFDGSLSYQFPIKSPPGRNGLDPKLSIVYSSKNADDTSAFGYGWSTNIPYIERINRRGANRMFNDNFYSSSFDGEVVASSTAANTEDYGPLVENGDFRVYQFKNRAYWRVTDKLGTIYTFGAASSSQLVNTASSTQVYRWYLNEVRDANGNYMTYTYTKDGAAIYPATITYTHSTSTAGIYEIAFSRENRSSHATSSVSGFPVVWKQRISEIQVKVNSSWVRKYTLGYTSGDNGGRNVLANIAETGRTEAGPSTN